MSLTQIWATSREQLQGKHVQQVIGIAGDGRLSDGGSTSSEFREFLGIVDSSLLARYADEALAGRFEGSGFALQDIVNEIGTRLGFAVTSGRYRGISGQIGFDGLWRSSSCSEIVVEVKTTDAYRIDLNTIADYRRELIRTGKAEQEESSILIIVGRQDTGDLEAQIRGSRHAWDIRLISVDALLRLLKVKESVDDPLIARKVSQVLVPREYTRVDGIIDVVFSTAEETQRTEAQSDPGSDQEEEPLPARGKKFIPSSFHAACIARIEKSLDGALVKQSPSTYKSSDGNTAVVCSVSREYLMAAGCQYWFAYHPYYNDVLETAARAFVAFGCGSSDAIVMIPFSVFHPLLEGMNTTERDNRHYWHVHIHQRTGRYALQRKASFEPVDVTKYLIA